MFSHKVQHNVYKFREYIALPNDVSPNVSSALMAPLTEGSHNMMGWLGCWRLGGWLGQVRLV